MIPDWQTNCVFFSSSLPERNASLWRDLSAVLQVRGVPVHLLSGTKDIWVRDFMPIQIQCRPVRFAKFVYDPDYLADARQLATPDSICQQVAHLGAIGSFGIRLDGGNVVAAPNKIIVTDKLFRENPSWSRRQLLSALHDALEVERIVVIPTDPDDEIGHADGLVRFASHEVVVMSDYSRVDRLYAAELRRVLEQDGLQIEPMPFFVTEEKNDDEISSAVGNYVNYLRLGSLVLLPTYGCHDDEKATATLERVLPKGSAIIPIRSSKLANEGGVLNCVSWTVEI